MKCPHCGLDINSPAPTTRCYLAFCSGCLGVVKVEDNELKVLSYMDKIYLKMIKERYLKRHMCN